MVLREVVKITGPEVLDAGCVRLLPAASRWEVVSHIKHPRDREFSLLLEINHVFVLL